MASVALLHRPADRAPPTSALTPAQAVELALLGITMAQPLAFDRVVGLLQRIASPLLQPTTEVIETRLHELARRGLLALAGGEPGRAIARRTAAGMRYARQLLRTPAPPPGAAHHDLVFMLKACLLELLADSDRATVIAELRQDLYLALGVAEQAARHCRSNSPFARHWLDRQVTRLRDDLTWLDALAAAGATQESSHRAPP